MTCCPVDTTLERVPTEVHKRAPVPGRVATPVQCIEVRCGGKTLKRFCGPLRKPLSLIYVALGVERTEPRRTPV